MYEKTKVHLHAVFFTYMMDIIIVKIYGTRGIFTIIVMLGICVLFSSIFEEPL